MTPKQYIELLKKENPRKFPDASQWPPDVVEMVSSLGIDLKAINFELQNSDYAEYLYGLLKTRLPEEIVFLVDSGVIAFAEIGKSTPSIWTERIDNSGFVIIFNSGLREFVYRLARAFSTRFYSSAVSGNVQDIETFENTAKTIAEIFWWYKTANTAFGPSYEISKVQLTIANRLAIEAELFLLAHELGHIVQMLAEDEGVDSALVESACIGINVSHAEEHISDRIGLSLTMGVYPKAVKPEFPQWTYAAALFVLFMYEGMETLNIAFSASHPSASNRISYLKEWMYKYCPDHSSWQNLTSIADTTSIVFNNVINLIKAPSTEQAAYFEAAAAQVLNQFEELLESCCEGLIPDYAKFCSNIGSILNLGYPEVIFDKMRNIREHCFESLRQHAVTPEFNVLFKKYKLLYSYTTGYAPNPAKELMLEALGLNELELSST